MLSPEERQIFERVSVFTGGFGFEAAHEVAHGDTFAGIASLVGKSLLVARPNGEDMRYQMLETISAFGLERLGDKISDAKDAHFAWAVNLAHEAAAHLEGPRQTEWLNKVETELRNFRAAMQWGIDSDQPATGLEIASTLYRYWWYRGIREGSLWLDLFLSLTAEMPDNILATGLYVAGSLDQALGKYEQAAQRLERSLALFRKLGDRRRAAYALHYMMRAQWGRIDPKKIREMIDAALTEFRDLEEANGVATSLVFVTFWEMGFGDPDRALDVAGDLEAACEMTGSPHQIAHGLELPAVALTQLRNYETARPRLHKALELYRQIGNQQCAAHCLENTAAWALGNGQPETSVVLLAATDAFRTDIGVPCPPFESLMFEDTLEKANATIGRAAFESAWQLGQSLDITKALDTAIRVTGDNRASRIARVQSGGEELVDGTLPVAHALAPEEGASGSESQASILGKPSIAVLPFDNMSADAGHAFFADGIVEDVITALSRFRSLFVVARHSSFTYRGRTVDVAQIARELGVRYVVEGSVRKADNRVRITALLIDATSGNHLWADRFDGDLDDVFDLQDQITDQIVVAIEPEIKAHERERARRKPPENLDAWEFVQRGLSHLYRANKSDHTEAIRLFEEAVALDPEFAAAHAHLAYALFRSVRTGYGEDMAKTAASGRSAAETAISLDPNEPLAHFAMDGCILQPARPKWQLARCRLR